MLSIDESAEKNEAAREQRAKDEYFAKWQGDPVTRMALALVPPSEQHPEALKLLLRSAFDAGCQAGSASTAMSFFKVLMPDKPSRER